MTTLTSPHDLIAAIPFLIGYHPTNSLVLVCLKDDLVGMAMRVDYPELSRTESSLEPYETLVSHLVREGAQSALVVAYVPDDRSDGEEVLDAIATSLLRADIELRESLHIYKGRYRSVLCGDMKCCPPEGNLLEEISTSRVAVEQVAEGVLMPFDGITTLVDSLSSLPLASDRDFIARVNEFRVDINSPTLHADQKDGAIAVIDLISRFIAGTVGHNIGADQELCARIIGRLSDIQVRDFALGSHDAHTLHTYALMWKYLVRIAPPGYVAPLASLLAAVSYESGAGALAQHCLDRAMADNAGYSLASLLRRVFSAGWPPQSFASLRAELHPKVCASIFDR